jgi:hypothetical protein
VVSAAVLEGIGLFVVGALSSGLRMVAIGGGARVWG